MRLIDANEFKRQIAGMTIVNNYSVDKANKMCELIDQQPTAYDVDNVVKELKENEEDVIKAIMENSISEFQMIKIMDLQKLFEEYTKEQIEIVKSGRIEGGVKR